MNFQYILSYPIRLKQICLRDIHVFNAILIKIDIFILILYNQIEKVNTNETDKESI